jgi:hypothetical protein
VVEGGNPAVDVEDSEFASIALGLLEEVIFKVPCRNCAEPMADHRELMFCLFDSGGVYTDPDGKKDLSLTAQQHVHFVKAGLALVRHQRELDQHPKLKKFLETWPDGNG